MRRGHRAWSNVVRCAVVVVLPCPPLVARPTRGFSTTPCGRSRTPRSSSWASPRPGEAAENPSTPSGIRPAPPALATPKPRHSLSPHRRLHRRARADRRAAGGGRPVGGMPRCGVLHTQGLRHRRYPARRSRPAAPCRTSHPRSIRALAKVLPTPSSRRPHRHRAHVRSLMDGRRIARLRPSGDQLLDAVGRAAATRR